MALRAALSCFVLVALSRASPFAPPGFVDLINASVFIASTTSRATAFAALLRREACSRLQLPLARCWPLLNSSSGSPLVVLATTSSGPSEGYDIRVLDDTVTISGNDERGLLYGVGRLLRETYFSCTRSFSAPPARAALVPAALSIASAPAFPLRGHQLGFRPKTNSYDAWTTEQMGQYISELAIFGANSVELLPPHTDDDAESPLFVVEPMDMLGAASRAADSLGLNVSLWYPAMYGNYTDPSVMTAAVKEWRGVFTALPRVDAVFIPGGDPGNHAPADLLGIARAQLAVLHESHPSASVWVGPQEWNTSVLSEWFALIGDPAVAAWLGGVVYGPWTTVDLPTFIASTPACFPVRLYPDLCHSTTAQLPAWAWDPALAATLHREAINPRPTQHGAIAAGMLSGTVGFSGYDEGVNDDVNKVVWAAVAWGADGGAQGTPGGATEVREALTQYARYFLGGGGSAGNASAAAGVIYALESNWVGPLLSNDGVPATLAAAQALLEQATQLNQRRGTAGGACGAWRIHQLLYRAYYDAFVQGRLAYETRAEASALAALSDAPATGSAAALRAATAALAAGVNASAADPRLQSLLRSMAGYAEALFQGPAGMQLSVPRYGAENTERGADLDQAAFPLNNAPYLLGAFAAIAVMPGGEPARLAAIGALAGWRDPGPGGFYDDLGVAGSQPHLLPGEGAATDPQFFRTALDAFATLSSQAYGSPTPPSFPAIPLTWLTLAKSMYGEALRLRYAGIDPAAADGYCVRIVYAGGQVGQGDGPLRLLANGELIHDWVAPPNPAAALTFDVPLNATLGRAALELACVRRWDPLQSPSHSGCAVAEVWLMRRNASGAGRCSAAQGY